MTWWTEDGHVVAPEPVIDLLVRAATGLRDEIMNEIDLEDADLQPLTGVPVFDNLDPRTRIFALAHVLEHLSEPDLPSPELHAWNEGTLWALFSAWRSISPSRSNSPARPGARRRSTAPGGSC